MSHSLLAYVAGFVTGAALLAAAHSVRVWMRQEAEKKESRTHRDIKYTVEEAVRHHDSSNLSHVGLHTRLSRLESNQLDIRIALEKLHQASTSSSH